MSKRVKDFHLEQKGAMEVIFEESGTENALNKKDNARLQQVIQMAGAGNQETAAAIQTSYKGGIRD